MSAASGNLTFATTLPAQSGEKTAAGRRVRKTTPKTNAIGSKRAPFVPKRHPKATQRQPQILQKSTRNRLRDRPGAAGPLFDVPGWSGRGGTPPKIIKNRIKSLLNLSHSAPRRKGKTCKKRESFALFWQRVLDCLCRQSRHCVSPPRRREKKGERSALFFLLFGVRFRRQSAGSWILEVMESWLVVSLDYTENQRVYIYIYI